VRFALTDDAYGVIIRGHITIENALESCIVSYLPDQAKPSDRSVKRFRSGFAQKVALAFRLGILDEAECDILSSFNELRNRIAHRFGGINSDSTEFEFDWKDEKLLWEKFTTNPAMHARWAEYDENQFPFFLRIVVLHLYLHLQRRVDALLKVRLSAPAVATSATELDKAAQTVLTLIVFELVSKVGDFRKPSEGLVTPVPSTAPSTT